MPKTVYSGPNGASASTPKPIVNGNETTVAMSPATILRYGSTPQPTGTDENFQADGTAMESKIRDCNFRPLKSEQNELNLLFYDQRFDKTRDSRLIASRPPAAFSRYFFGVMLASSISNG